MIGLAGTFYPYLSNWLFDRQIESAAQSYETEIAKLSDVEQNALLEAARACNRRIAEARLSLTIPYAEPQGEDPAAGYEELLNPDGSGIMGYLTIPSLSIRLPVFHGTSDAVLKRGAGHLQGSSLPVGGADTHAVITGHTGISTARLFTDLTELQEGDRFLLNVLNQTLTYEVCQIRVVLPEETSCLQVETGRDLVTLITCTPYGINDHRLLVTGTRVPNDPDPDPEVISARSTGNPEWKHSYLQAVCLGIGIALLLLLPIALLRRTRKKRR